MLLSPLIYHRHRRATAAMSSGEIEQDARALARDMVHQQPSLTLRQWVLVLNRTTTDVVSIEVVSMVLSGIADVSRPPSVSASKS